MPHTPDRLKILISLLYYLPHRTGLSIHVQHVAEALAARGHQVTVLAARHSIDLPRDETINGVRIVRLWTPPVHMSRGMIMPLFPFALYAFMRRYDLIFINTPMLETAIVAVVAQLTGKPVVATHHGDLILPSGLSNRVIQGLMFKFYEYMAKRAARLIAYSEDYAQNSYYLKPYLNKVTPNYPPIKMPEPDPVRVQELRGQWQIGDGPIIGYSGRFVAEKRPDVLLRSLEIVNQKYPNARVVFAGQYNIPYEHTWELYQPLVEKYKDQLIFLGLITSMEAMANFYAACDVLVLPSDTECFALVQVEAMLSGTPVIMTDTPGGRVPVTVTQMGKIFPRGDWKALGAAVIDVLSDPGAYTKPRTEIERIFNMTETINRYETEFQRAVHDSRQRRRKPTINPKEGSSKANPL